MTSNLNSQSVSYLAVDHAHSVCFQGQPQKKGISPCTQKIEIKDVKGVSCASQCLFAPHVPNVPNVVPNLAVGGQVTEVLARLAHTGCESKGGLNFERGIHATLQNQTTSDQVPCDQEWLCSPGEKQGLIPSIGRTHKQVGGRKSGDKVLPGLLQPPFSGTKIQPQIEAYLGTEPSNLILKTRHLQDGNSRNAGLQRCLFSHPHQSEIPEVPQVFSREESLSIYGPSFRCSQGSPGIYQGSQGGETDGSSTGYPDPPVPRRLVSQSIGPGNLPTAYPDPLGPVPRTRVGGKHGEI